MKNFSTYIFALIISVVIILELLKVIKLLFNPIFLKHKVYDFPKRKFSIFLYHICAILVLLVTVLRKLEIITFEI